MEIEQTLVCDMKSEGWLTRERGLNYSVLAKWVEGPFTATAICSSLEVFASIHFMSGEQHIDFRVSRINIGDQIRGKLVQWLADNPPFAVRYYNMSLSAGVIGNSNRNCHKAVEIGSLTMELFVGTNFAEMKQSKKNAEISWAAIRNTINSLRRLRFGQQFSKLKTSDTLVYGGFLLHGVKWNVGTKSSSICEQYVSYIINHYGANSAVVFDGYEDLNSTKRTEQKQRGTSKTSVDVNIDENMLASVQQENFLANEKNKTKLIELLVETLTARGIEASTATGDTDGRIVRCGLNKVTSHSFVVVIGENVDLLVLQTDLTPPDRNVYFMRPGRGNIEDKVYSTRQI
ncbi:hypothetical protein PR048_008942 [Dryococelus australis]|uniref:Uncharacterized protein n=1 Tax=Dryococelus australis TaxID=614101 RepID=A0ABQ9HYH8_9NEOP|nr:hypothetical protein PR048_008942 [Dryococelus australis]